MNTKLTLLTLTLFVANNLNCMDDDDDRWDTIRTIIIRHPDSPEIAHALESYRPYIHKKGSINEWSLLHASVYANKFYATKYCLAFGNDVNAKSCSNSTPLHIACWQRTKPEVMQALLNTGADLTAKDSDGLIPIQHARRMKHLDLVTILENEPARRRWARKSDWLAAVVMASARSPAVERTSIYPKALKQIKKL